MRLKHNPNIVEQARGIAQQRRKYIPQLKTDFMPPPVEKEDSNLKTRQRMRQCYPRVMARTLEIHKAPPVIENQKLFYVKLVIKDPVTLEKRSIYVRLEELINNLQNLKKELT